jgi:hypothetical protein
VRLGRGKKVRWHALRQGTQTAPARLRKLRDEVGRLLIKRHTQIMRLFKSWRFARVALLLAIVSLLCVGAFHSLLPTGIDVPAALTTADSPHVNQGTNGGWHSLDAIYLAVSAEEAEKVDEHPVDADLLTALLLLAVSFWATAVWLLTNCRGQGTFRSLGIDRRRRFLSALEDRPFLSVFRL